MDPKILENSEFTKHIKLQRELLDKTEELEKQQWDQGMGKHGVPDFDELKKRFELAKKRKI